MSELKIPVKFIRATLDDVRWIVDLTYSEMNNYLENAYNGPFDYQQWEHDLRQVIDTGDITRGYVELFLSNENEKIGYWWITPQIDHLWLDAFVIVPHWQGKGIGAYLIHALTHKHFHFYRPKNKRIELGVQMENTRAIEFYKRHNFFIQQDTYLNMFKTHRMILIVED